MSRRVKSNCVILKVLAKCKPCEEQSLELRTKKIYFFLLEAITEWLLNICKDTIKISLKTYKKLAPYSNHIETVADKSKPITQ